MRLLVTCSALCLFMPGCSTPDQQFQRLQRDFIEYFPRPDDYVIIEKNDTLRLKLPPDSRLAQRMSEAAQALLLEAQAIPKVELNPENRQNMTAFCDVLQKACAPDSLAALDPAPYALDVPLSHFNGDNIRYPALLTRFAEEIPAYYTRVEKHWRQPERSRVNIAVERSLEALRHLNEIEEKKVNLPAGFRQRLEKAIPQARLAIKDFIALCRSGLLE